MKTPLTGYLVVQGVWKKLGLLAVLGAAVHLILPQLASLEHSWLVLKTLTPWAVGLAFIAQALSYLGSGFLLQSLLRLTKTAIKLFHSTLIVLGASSVGMVAGGILGSSAAIYRWTSQEQSHPEGAMLASVLPPILNNLILVLVSIFGLVHLILAHNLSQAQLIGFSTTILILSLVIGAVFLALRYRQRTLTTVRWFAKRLSHLQRKPFDLAGLKAYTESLFSAWDILRGGAWGAPALGAVLNVVFDMLTIFFLFAAAGHPVSLAVLISGYGLPLLLGKVAFMVPGGVGVVEASMTVMYTGLGVPDSIAVIVVLGYRFISFWLPSLSGFPIAAYLQSDHKRLKTV